MRLRSKAGKSPIVNPRGDRRAARRSRAEAGPASGSVLDVVMPAVVGRPRSSREARSGAALTAVSGKAAFATRETGPREIQEQTREVGSGRVEGSVRVSQFVVVIATRSDVPGSTGGKRRATADRPFDQRRAGAALRGCDGSFATATASRRRTADRCDGKERFSPGPLGRIGRA